MKESMVKNAQWYARRLRAAAITMLGGLCVQCGFSDIRALQIDHVNGGGAEDRRSRGSWSNHHIYREILDTEGQSPKYQLLCANCNWIKRSISKEYGPTIKTN